MKIEKVAICLLGFFLSLSPTVQADDRVQDEVITTTDRTCGIHYLTHNNVIGWYLSEVEGACPSGLLNGAGRATLRNAFGKVVKTVNGFFIQGYPVQENYKDITFKTLWLSDTDNQSLVFDLGQEEQLDIRYLGKMSATRQEDNSYSAFQACNPAVVLAVTPITDLFEDESVQQEIINSVLNRLTFHCPEIHQIYLYGSAIENPENKDIVFFADINLDKGHIKVRRVPSSPRIRDVLTDPSDNADIPLPKKIRQETGLPVVQITPIKHENKAPSVLQTTRIISQPENLVSKEAESGLPVKASSPILKEAISQKSEEEIMIPDIIPEPIPVSTEDSSSWDDIPALLTASRLLKQPVKGKAFVHIVRFDQTGIALTDSPVALRLRGKDLPLGNLIVTGNFSYTSPKNTNDTIGFVEVQSFIVALPEGEK